MNRLFFLSLALLTNLLMSSGCKSRYAASPTPIEIANYGYNYSQPKDINGLMPVTRYIRSLSSSKTIADTSLPARWFTMPPTFTFEIEFPGAAGLPPNAVDIYNYSCRVLLPKSKYKQDGALFVSTSLPGWGILSNTHIALIPYIFATENNRIIFMIEYRCIYGANPSKTTAVLSRIGCENAVAFNYKSVEAQLAVNRALLQKLFDQNNNQRVVIKQIVSEIQP